MQTSRFNAFLYENMLRKQWKILFRLNSSKPLPKEGKVELAASDAPFKNLHIPKMVGRLKSDAYLEKGDKSLRSAINYIHKKLSTPDTDFVTTLCRVHPPLIELASDKIKFRAKLKFLHKLDLENDQLFEAPWIFSVPEKEVAKSAKSWKASGVESPHPFLLLPNELNPIFGIGGGPGRRKAYTKAKEIEKEKTLLVKTIGSHGTNAALLAHELGITRVEVYDKAKHFFPLIVKGYRYVEKIRLAKLLGLDPRFVLTHYENFVTCKPEKMNKRVKMLLDIFPHVKDVDLLDSGAIFMSDVEFNVFYVNNKRAICNVEFSSQVKAKVSLVSYLLNIPEDLVLDFVEIYKRVAPRFLSQSDQKLTSCLQYLLDAGFSGPEILRNPHITSLSLYNLGHAIERVKLQFDLEEISDAYLPDVVRVAQAGTATRDYNLLSFFVLTNLAALLETSPSMVRYACNQWTRGRLRQFLKLEKTPKNRQSDFSGEADAEIEEISEDEVLSMGKNSQSPWQTLKGNVELLAKRGFDKDAIRRCLFVAANQTAALVGECDAHLKEESAESLRELTIGDQVVFLNLIAYHMENRKQKRDEPTSLPPAS